MQLSFLVSVRSTPSEDMQSKYERVVATSFLAIGCLLQQLSAKQKTGFYDQLDALFGQSKLWKYGKSKVPSVCDASSQILMPPLIRPFLDSCRCLQDDYCIMSAHS